MKKMQEIHVDSNETDIVISQPVGGGDDQVVWVSPDQVDVLIQWLKEEREKFTKPNA